MSAEFEPKVGSAQKRVGGLLDRRECWRLTLTGWFVVMAMAVALGFVVPRTMYPFLAVTERMLGQVLVVEGWTPTEAIKEAAAEFQRGRYRQVLIVEGVPGTEAERAWSCEKSENIARLLVQYQVPPEIIRAIQYPVDERDRTYHGALAVKQWIAEHAPTTDSLDIATRGAHARRSRLLYEKAFGPGFRVGVVALRRGPYDPSRWWQSSEGIREVPFEAVAYLYVRFLFSTHG